MKYSLLIFLLFSLTFVKAQMPQNDSCGSAATVVIGKKGYQISTYQSDSISIDSATIQVGEFFHSSMVTAGNDKKSIWFKFYIPARRGVNIELKQNANAIAIRDCGFTTYFGDQCLPTSTMATAAKLTTLNQFGSSFHPCMEPGWYMVQVSAKSRAAGKVFIEITTSFPYTHSGVTDAKYDATDSAYYWGDQIVGNKRYQSQYIDFEMGCYTITDSTELYKPIGQNYAAYSQSAWFVFKAKGRSDFASIGLKGYNFNFGANDTVAYRLYKGDCRKNSSLFQLDSGSKNFGSPNSCYQYYYDIRVPYSCLFDSGEYYSFQLLMHKDEYRTVRITLDDATSEFDSSNNRPINGSIRDLGTIKGVTNFNFGFSCYDKLKNNICGNSNLVSGVNYGLYNYNMATWFKIKISETSKLSFSVSDIGYPYYNSQFVAQLAYRVFKDTATSNCSNVDTSSLLLQAYGGTTSSLLCLEKGEYLIQVLGMDSTINYSNWACYGSMHLGRDFKLYITQENLPNYNKFSLYQVGWADSIYPKADTISPLPYYTTVNSKTDTVSCNNTVLPEVICDSTYKKAMYRTFVIGDANKDGIADSGLLRISNLPLFYNNKTSKYDFVDHRLYKGNALKLRQSQSVFSYPDTLKGLRPYTSCFGKSQSYEDICIEPGEYTLVSFFDENVISQTETPNFFFASPKTKYNSYAKAENLGILKNYTSYYGNYDTFSCLTNPDTIDGVYCGNRNTYHVFYLDSAAVATIGINYYYAYTNAGSRWSLFTGDIRNGKAGLRKYNNGGDWTCKSNYYTRSVTDCSLMQPGWYTLMVSNENSISYDSANRMKNDYSAYYLHNYPHRIEINLRKSTLIPTKYDKPFKIAHVDSLINNNKPLDYANNYSTYNGMPQNLAKYVFPTEYIQCELDTPFTHYKQSNICRTNTTNIVYYKFSISKPSWVSFSTASINAIKLYNFDISKDTVRMDTAVPIQNCNPNPNYIEFCNLQLGTYSLVCFVSRSAGQSISISPIMYIDSVMKTRFDHAWNAYDFGLIPGDSNWHNGKVGDVNPLNSALAPSNDIITCSAGSQFTDPSFNCYAQYNPFMYKGDSNVVIYPYDSSYTKVNGQNVYYNSYAPRRNIWYTFTHKGPGKLSIKINTIPHKNAVDVGNGVRFTIYESDATGNLDFNNLKTSGQVDSTLASGLKFINTDPYYNYCYWAAYPTREINYSICDPNKEKRYYVLVDMNNYQLPYTYNHHVWLDIKYDSAIQSIEKTNYDHYSNAGRLEADTINQNLLLNGSSQFDNQFWTNNFYSIAKSTVVPYGAGTSFLANGYYRYNAKMQQTVDLNAYKAIISGGNGSLALSGFTNPNANLSGSEGAYLILECLDASNNVIATQNSGNINCTINTWKSLSVNINMPSQTVAVRVTVGYSSPSNYYLILNFSNLVLNLKNSGVVVQKSLQLKSGQINQFAKNYMGQATIDTADYNKSWANNCGKSVWYKIKIDSTGYFYYNINSTYNSGSPFIGYSDYWMKLYKEVIPGDSINGLQLMKSTISYTSKIGYAAYTCVSPGWYYLLVNPGCTGYNQTCLDYNQPQYYVDYHRGDFCDNAIGMQIDTIEKVTETALVNCHTIGNDFGEDGTNMGCLFGPKGYKSTWFVVDYTDTTKVDLEFKLAEYTDAKPADIRYRTYYGNCRSLTPAPCNTNAATSFTLDCIRKGTYYIQVVSPENALGTLDMSVEAKKNTDTTCDPVDIFQPNAAFYYNTSCPENVIEFINTSSRGDSISYFWDFGYNGITSTLLNPVIAYPPSAQEKTYKVKLVANMVTRNSKDSVIIDVIVPYSPYIDVINNDTMVCDGQSVILNSAISHGNGYWNTGDTSKSIKVSRTDWYKYKMQEQPNLLINANGELPMTTGWTISSGSWTRRSSTPYPQDSTYYFYAGNATGVSELYQIVNVSKDSLLIDAGLAKTSLISYVYSLIEATPDETQVSLEYLDANNNLLALYRSGYIVSKGEWSKLVHSRTTPALTRKLKVTLQSNNLGNNVYSDGFFDNIVLRMRSACDYVDSVYVQVNPIPVLKLGKDTSFCYHDSVFVIPQTNYTNPYFINDPMDVATLKGELRASAKYISINKYVTLTEETSAQSYGSINYSDSALLLKDSFDISFDFLTANRDGLNGHLTALCLFNKNKQNTLSDIYQGGYTFLFEEFNYNNIVRIYWGGSQLTTFKPNITFADGLWKKVLIKYNNQSFQFYIDGKLVYSYKDNTARTQTGYNYALAASNGSYQNEHLVRNLFITKSKTNIQLPSSAAIKFNYLWSDNATNSIKVVNQSGTYFVRATDQNGCISNYDTITIQKIKLYDSLISSAYQICSELDSFRLNSIVKGGFFYGNSNADSSGLWNVKSSPLGTNNIFYLKRDSLGCIYRDTAIVIVDSVPSISITPVSPVCRNSSAFKLGVNNSLGFFYGGNYIDSLGWFTPSITTQRINQVFYRTYGTDCVGKDTIQIIVDSLPNASITAAGPFCKNSGMQQLVPKFNTGGAFFGGAFIDSAGRFNPIVAGAGNHKIYYTFKDGNTCSNTDSIVVRVDSISNAAIVVAGPFCKNAGVQQLAAVVNNGGKFFGGAFVDSVGKFNPFVANTGLHKVYYTFKDGNSCSNTDSITVRVDSIPDASITPAGPFCENAVIQTLTPKFNVGGKFTVTAYLDSIGKFNPTIAKANNHKVFYTFKDGNGCFNTDSLVVRVDSIPNAAITAAGPFCKNSGMQIIIPKFNMGGKFTGGSFIDSAGNFNPVVAGAGNQKIYYTFKDGNTCSNTDSIVVRVDSIPNAAIVAAGPFCKNAGVKKLVALVNNGGKFFGGSFIDSAGNFNPLVANTGMHTIYYSFKDGNTCSNTDSTTVRVDSIPDASITPAGPFCENAIIQTLTPKFNMGGKFTVTGYLDSTGKFNPAVAKANNHKIFYTFKDGNGCSNTDSLVVRVDSIPNAAITAAGPFCKNSGMQIIIPKFNMGGKFTGGSFIDSAGNFNPVVAGAGNHKIYYTFKDGNTCSNTDSIVVRVDSIPNAAIVGAGPFCKNAGVQQLAAVVNNGGKFFGGTFVDSVGKFNPLMAGVGLHKVLYSFKDGNGCANTDSTVVRVDSIPDASITPAGPFCENAIIQTLTPKFNVGGKFTVTAYLDSIGKFNPTIAKANNHKIFYTFKDGNGCFNTDSLVVRVDSIPNAAITTAGPFCKNSGLQQLVPKYNAGGTFFGGAFIDSAGKFNPNISGSGNHKIYYTFKDGNTCSNADSIVVRVDSIPNAAIVAAGPFCKNAGVKKLVALVNNGGKFFGGAFVDSVGKFNPFVANTGLHKVYYTFKDGNSCSNTDSITVRVDSIPDASITPAGPFCENAIIQTLTPKFNVGGKFTVTAYLDSIGKFNPTIAKANNHKIFYTFKDGNGCFNTDSLVVRVDSIPNAAITTAGPFCKNSGMQIIIPKFNMGGKFTGGSFIDSAGNFNPVVAGAGNHKIYYTFKDGNTCSNTDSIVIRVDSIPNAAIVTAGPFCKNAGTKKLVALVNNGGKFFGGNFIDSAGNFNPFVANTGIHTIYYSFKDGNGCSNTDSTTVRVDSIPDASITPAGPFCENAIIQTLTPKFNMGGKFTVTGYLDSTGKFNPAMAKANSHKVFYTFIDGNGCVNTDSTIVVVNLLPNAKIVPVNPLCAKDTAFQLKNAEAGGTFSGGTYVSNTGLFNPSLANFGNNKVIYEIVYANSCSSIDSIEINVADNPNNTITLFPNSGCDPLDVQFETQPALKITWKLNNVLYTKTKEYVTLKAGNYVLSLEVENAAGCKQVLSENIQVFKPAIADFSFTPPLVYISNPQYFFKDKSLGNVTGWKWYFGDNDSTDFQNPDHIYSKAGLYNVQLYIVDNNGCLDSAMHQVRVMDEILYFIPTAFSPNGDGHNDVFKITGLGYTKANCIIYNRWGEKIFETDNFESWDGTYKGEIVQNGVYIYILTLTDNKHIEHYEKGSVKVIR